MEKLKAITKFLWVPLVGFALWIVYRIFVKKGKEDDITPNNSGLTAKDVAIFNQVVSNLSNGGNPLEYNWYDFIFIPLSGLLHSDNLQDAAQLAELLNNVENKSLFAKVYYEKFETLLTTSIFKVYGQDVYNMIARNVPNFSLFTAI